MRFLADESCDSTVVRRLRAAGHDVLAVAETSRGATDLEVVKLAKDGDYILVTEDKDFGQLVFASRRGGVGVVLLRFPASAGKQMPEAVLGLVTAFGERLPSSFVVLEPGRVRIGPPPLPGHLVEAAASNVTAIVLSISI